MLLSRNCMLLFLVILLLPVASLAGSGTYNYISAKELEFRLNSKLPTNILDIQVEEKFSQQHIKGAKATYAYPVKSDADRAKLDVSIDELNGNNDPVVIVCPRGGGGAKRTYDYLLKKGIPGERLLILEKGQAGWACTPLTESR